MVRIEAHENILGAGKHFDPGHIPAAIALEDQRSISVVAVEDLDPIATAFYSALSESDYCLFGGWAFIVEDRLIIIVIAVTF